MNDSRMSIEAGQYFDIWRLLSEPRSDNEAVLRSLCRSVYLGNDTALCRVLGRYKMYVDTRDVSISSHLMLEGYWEMWVTESMMRHVRQGMTVLDIGANLGYFTMLLADLVGPTGRVLAFEPNPEMAGRLRRSIGLNGFSGTTTLHEIALGAEDGTMLLDVTDDMPGGAHLVAMPDAPAEAQVETPEAAIPKPEKPKALRADHAPAAAPETAPAQSPEPGEAATPTIALPELPPLPPLPDWTPAATQASADLPRPAWPRPTPLAPVVVTMPPPPPAPEGMLARLAARVGFVSAAAMTEARAAAQAAIEAANAEINAAAQVRIEAAIVEAIAAGEMTAGARIAATEAAAAARAAAEAARAIHAQAMAATRAVAQGAIAVHAEAISAIRVATETARAAEAQMIARIEASAEAARANQAETSAALAEAIEQAMAALARATDLMTERAALALAPAPAKGMPGRSLPAVPVRRLDEIPGAMDAEFIKMDVEGAEHMVWTGMSALLAQGNALTIFMEFTIARFDDPDAFLDEIFSHGFSMAIIEFNDGIVPITRKQLFARSHHADNMLVFTRAAQTPLGAQE